MCGFRFNKIRSVRIIKSASENPKISQISQIFWDGWMDDRFIHGPALRLLYCSSLVATRRFISVPPDSLPVRTEVYVEPQFATSIVKFKSLITIGPGCRPCWCSFIIKAHGISLRQGGWTNKSVSAS